MKILYIGSFDKPWKTEAYIARALRKLGHNVKTIDETECNVDEVLSISSQYDFLLFSKLRIKNKHKLLRQIKIPTVCWVFDLYWALPRVIELYHDPIFKADLVFTTEDGHEEEYKRLGIKHYCLRQGIAEEEAYIGKFNPKYATDIVFVGKVYGTWHPGRLALLEFLKANYGSRFKLYGENEEIRGKELNDLFASVKIVMGDTIYAPFAKGWWSNRIYETLGRGGFLIHPKVKGLEKEFRYYQHFVPYDFGNWEQLKEIIDFYLKHDKERRRIQLAGHRFCKENYTYRERCKKLIRIVQKEIFGKKFTQ